MGYSVYVHTNKINGKKYIGQTCREPSKRWNYGYGYKNNVHFWNAICKYGWDNFDHEIVADNLAKDEADDLEKSLIGKFNTTNQKYGYNITLGGGGTLGRYPSQETKDKISKTKTGKYSGVNHPRATKVAQYDLDGNLIKVWEYIKEAAKELCIKNSDISICCKGEHFSTGGFIWKYVEDEDNVLPKIVVNKPEKGLPRQVLCVETGVIYESIAEACKQNKVHRSNVIKCCKNPNRITGGYHWEYVNEGGVN